MSMLNEQLKTENMEYETKQNNLHKMISLVLGT